MADRAGDVGRRAALQVPRPIVPASDADAALALFGPSLAKATRYAELLAGPGVERGLIGPAEAGRLWSRHLLNCGAIASLMPSSGTLVDVGSGAGLPGLVLAILVPGLQVTLLEPMARRVDFLELCVAELELSNAAVLRGRAEDLAGQLSADVVTARAVAPMAKLAVLCAGLARPGGRVVAIKGASAGEELTRARPTLKRLGAGGAQVLQVGSGEGDVTATVVVFTTAA